MDAFAVEEVKSRKIRRCKWDQNLGFLIPPPCPMSLGKAYETRSQVSRVLVLGLLPVINLYYPRSFLQLVDSIALRDRGMHAGVCECVYSFGSKYLSSALDQALFQALEIKQFTQQMKPLFSWGQNTMERPGV